MTDCLHNYVEVTAHCRCIKTPQEVRVGDEIQTEPMPEGYRVYQCSLCGAVAYKEPESTTIQ